MAFHQFVDQTGQPKTVKERKSVDVCGYRAKETTEHVLYEMLSWFDKYVKNAKPRDAK